MLPLFLRDEAMSVVTYFLKILKAKALQYKPKLEQFEVVAASIKEYRLNRYFSQLVRENWGWIDKLQFSD